MRLSTGSPLTSTRLGRSTAELAGGGKAVCLAGTWSRDSAAWRASSAGIVGTGRHQHETAGCRWRRCIPQVKGPESGGQLRVRGARISKPSLIARRPPMTMRLPRQGRRLHRRLKGQGGNARLPDTTPSRAVRCFRRLIHQPHLCLCCFMPDAPRALLLAMIPCRL